MKQGLPKFETMVPYYPPDADITGVAALRKSRDFRLKRDPNDVRLELVKIITELLVTEDKVDRAARTKIRTQKREISEGTEEWDLLHRRYYAEELKKLGIDLGASKAEGFRTDLMELAITAALGTLMAVGLMMLPAAAARFWARDITSMLAVSAVVGAASGYAGLLLSYHTSIPSGPAVILVAGGIYAASVVFGPVGGLILRLVPRRHLEA